MGFYTTSSGKKSIIWPEAADEALCVGWIDGVRRIIDAQSHRIRFTPGLLGGESPNGIKFIGTLGPYIIG